MEEITSVHKILFGKSKGKRPLGRPRCGQGDNIKMDLREIVWSGVHYIHLAPGTYWRLAINTIMNFRVPVHMLTHPLINTDVI
jgi:hypothetical protein